MNAHESLAKAVENEAAKILTKSKGSPDLLAGADLDALEVLSRCAKALRVPVPPAGKPGEEEPDDVPQLLKAAQ